MKIFETAYDMNKKGVYIDSEHGHLYINPNGKIQSGNNLLNDESQIRAKKDILEAEFVCHRNGFEYIAKLLNQHENLTTQVSGVST